MIKTPILFHVLSNHCSTQKKSMTATTKDYTAAQTSFVQLLMTAIQNSDDLMIRVQLTLLLESVISRFDETYRYLNVAGKEVGSRLIVPEIYSSSNSVYLHPFNVEVAHFCKAYIESLGVNVVVHNYQAGAIKHMNFTYANSVNINRLVDDLKQLLLFRFGK